MKRFYDAVSVVAADGGWSVALDGRRVRTVGGAPQVAPGRAAAEALAAEWAAQGETIAPNSFFLRDIADYAIDRIAPDRASARDALLAFAETDTLSYRAEAGSALAERQYDVWEPILRAVETRHGVRFERIEGIARRPQPVETHARLRDALVPLDDFTLSALLTCAGIAGSLSVALQALETADEPDALFAAANLEQDWQAVQWGWDTAALAERDGRARDFRRAAEFARLVAQGG